MHIDAATLVYFSPTQSTRKILDAMAQGLGVDVVTRCDLTNPGAICPETPAHSVTLLGVPVYAGRVPGVAAARMRRLDGRGGPVVLVVTYGNRAYEDALLELHDLAVELGFAPVAAGAFIGEHSFSTPATPIAQGRPDEADLQAAWQFGTQVMRLLTSAPTPSALTRLEIPGNRPYREVPERPPRAPVADAALCVQCGICVDICPVNAIELRGDAVNTDARSCIFCCACVKNCPEGALSVRDPELLGFVEQLAKRCSDRREPEFHQGALHEEQK